MGVLGWSCRLRYGTVQAGTTDSCRDVGDFDVTVAREGTLLHLHESQLVGSFALLFSNLLQLLRFGLILLRGKEVVRIHRQVDDQNDRMCETVWCKQEV